MSVSKSTEHKNVFGQHEKYILHFMRFYLFISEAPDGE